MKVLLKSVAALLLIVLLAMVAFVLLVDANRFKPHIEAIAKEQGIALHINGDLGWDLWPRLGVAVNDVSVAALESPDEPVARLQQASLMLALMPLLSGDFQVDHVAVEGAAITLKVDAAGKNNWDALSQSDSPANAAHATSASTPTPAASAESGLKLDIERLSFSNSSVRYEDAQTAQTINLRDINLTMSDVNTQARPFAMELSLVMELARSGADAVLVDAVLKNSLSIDSTISAIKLDEGNLRMQLKAADSASLDVDYTLMLTDVQKNLAYQGQIKLSNTNARKLLAALGAPLETANSSALSKLAFSSAIVGDSNKVQFDNLQLIVDDTVFSGNLAVTDFSTSAIKAILEADQFNLDDYLPPPAEPQSEQATAASAEDTMLPLESLRELNINAKLAFKKIIVHQIALENAVIKVVAKNGMIEPSLKANAYSGTIATKGQLDVRGQQAQLQFDADIAGLELAPLLSDMKMDSSFGLQGAVQARALGTGKGNSVNQLLKSLNSNATFSGAQVRVSPINLEQQFCKLVNLVNKAEDPAQDWEEYTELEELSGSIKLHDEIVTIDTFKAGIEKLQVGSRGKINLAADTYDIFLPFKLIKNSSDTVTTEQVAVTTSANGCSVGSAYWLERGLELLRCKGSFADINPLSDCRPDKDLLLELTKDYAAYKIKEKHGAKIEEKKEELKQKVEDEKQRLLDKLQQRLNKGKSSAAATSAAAEPDGQAAQ
ncbi:AsmA family protein [Cellvibrio sp. pealriver]|uniref:AsmA family protein n=1 Tax=Cellvibrio sp. pealriver TaxID=1622269 RepID=UPI00066FFD4D|nr:AsmA family protein [Cellvibrio sp. pealriver]